MDQKTILSASDQFYVWLLSFYPKAYIKEYGEQMLYVFRDLYREEIDKKGELDIFFWFGIIKDVTVSSFQQHMENIKNKKARSTLSFFISSLLSLIFLIPAIAASIYTLPFVIEMLSLETTPWVILDIFIFPTLFITGMVVSIVIYLITAIYLLANIFNIKNIFFIFIRKVYERYKPYIVISNTLSMAIYLQWTIFLFPSPLNILASSSGPSLLFQAFFITVIALAQFVKPGKITQSITMLFVSSLTIFAGFILFDIYIEFQPHHYGVFPLDDTKGVYKLNYDGDYWLTYYHTKEECIRINNVKTCSQSLIKVGNTSITESPKELDKYLDKSVIVTGEFIKINGPEDNRGNKQFCIKTGMIPNCRKSTGPGIWYYSPLKIHSIELR